MAMIFGLMLAGCGQPAAQPQAPAAQPPAQTPGAVAGQADSEGQQEQAPKPTEYVFGASLPLTGTAAFYGEITKNGFDLAVKAINDAGGVDGVPVRMVYEDSQLESRAGVTALQKLVDVHRVPVVFTAGSAVVLSQSPLASEQQIVLANIGAQSAQLRHEGPWVFTFIATSDVEARGLAEVMIDDLGITEYAIIHVDNDYGIDSAAAFRRTADAKGARMLALEQHPTGAVDMRTQLIKIKAQEPPALVIFSQITEVGHIVRQARDLGINSQILGTTWTGSADNIEIAGDAMNGIIGVRVAFNPSAASGSQAFLAAYLDAHGTPPTVHSAIAYDALSVVAEIVGRVGYDTGAIQEGLLTVQDFEGVLGSLTMDSDGLVIFPLTTYKIEDLEVVDLD